MPISQGHLNPGDGQVVFDRFELGPTVAQLVRHVWVVRWAVPPGEVRLQRVLAYPAPNAVFQTDGVRLYGLDPRLDIRELRGRSWAVGVLFRPAAATILASARPRALIGSSEPLPGAPFDLVNAVMTPVVDAELVDAERGDGEREVTERCDAERVRHRLVDILTHWLGPLAGAVDARGRLINDVCRIAESDSALSRVDELAKRSGLSMKALERLVQERLGVTPKWLIECRRLQRAATRLYVGPAVELSGLAAELGYADYPHFSRRYKTVLGETPEQTRQAGADRA